MKDFGVLRSISPLTVSETSKTLFAKQELCLAKNSCLQRILVIGKVTGGQVTPAVWCRTDSSADEVIQVKNMQYRNSKSCFAG